MKLLHLSNKHNTQQDQIKPDQLIRRTLILLSITISIIGFFGWNIEIGGIKLSNKIPEVTLFIIGIIVLNENLERKALEEKYFSEIESGKLLCKTCKFINELENNLANSISSSEKWLSLYQNQDYGDEGPQWHFEEIKLLRFEKVVTLESSRNSQGKKITAIGKVENGCFIGTWKSNNENSGHFLLEINNHGNMYGFFNSPGSQYNHFYKWVLVATQQEGNPLNEMQIATNITEAFKFLENKSQHQKTPQPFLEKVETMEAEIREFYKNEK
ncbi:MAG: hypothetical protein VKL42_09625 [Snowella sp.]|nr:hypothetical protein [Snowella sp.]